MFPDEELVVALCQLNCADRPQILRLASQFISRNQLNLNRLLQIATMERARCVIEELAVQALKVDPQHPAWLFLNQSLQKGKKARILTALDPPYRAVFRPWVNERYWMETSFLMNALIILKELDARLNMPVELTLYGRAAIQLGYPNPPKDALSSLDVDAVFFGSDEPSNSMRPLILGKPQIESGCTERNKKMKRLLSCIAISGTLR